MESFSTAIIHAEAGSKVFRESWIASTGRAPYVFRVDLAQLYQVEQFGARAGKDVFYVGTMRPFLAFKGLDGQIMPWTPTPADLRARDWRVLDEAMELAMPLESVQVHV